MYHALWVSEGLSESQTVISLRWLFWKIHLQMLQSHPRMQDIMPPIAILLIPKEMVVKVQDLRGLKSAFQLTAQTSSGVILLEWLLLDVKVASMSTTGHGKSVVQKTHDQVRRRQGDARECHASERMDNSSLRVDQLFTRRRHEETGVCNYEADSLNRTAKGKNKILTNSVLISLINISFLLHSQLVKQNADQFILFDC